MIDCEILIFIVDSFFYGNSIISSFIKWNEWDGGKVGCFLFKIANFRMLYWLAGNSSLFSRYLGHKLLGFLKYILVAWWVGLIGPNRNNWTEENWTESFQLLW